MKIQHHASLRLLLGALALLLGASCVSQAKYREAQEEIKYYQRAYQDLASYQGKLEAQNTKLIGELELRGDQPIEAGATREIDERLAELSKIMDGLGSTPGTVTVLPVEGGYGLRLQDAILFDSGSADLKPEGKALLLKMAEEIKNRPYSKLWVRGHTDSDPIVRKETLRKFPHGNLELSAARAIAVAALLTDEGGVPAEKLVVAGFGDSEPVAPNTKSEKAKNRRVELFVIDATAGKAGK
ncbi:MAG TPA: hypothetical protein ENJ09_04510 [Planctomycetes bacterium]|nr:hypothetical protein [Planctomycetota bacterium]